MKLGLIRATGVLGDTDWQLDNTNECKQKREYRMSSPIHTSKADSSDMEQVAELRL